jgi:hypothetical protein
MVMGRPLNWEEMHVVVWIVQLQAFQYQAAINWWTLPKTIIISQLLKLSVASPPIFAVEPTQPSATTNKPRNPPKQAELRLETRMIGSCLV